MLHIDHGALGKDLCGMRSPRVKGEDFRDTCREIPFALAIDVYRGVLSIQSARLNLRDLTPHSSGDLPMGRPMTG
jgi:hypothetical protein